MYDKIRGISSVSVIGHITEKGSGNYLIGADGTEVELTAQGWKKKNKKELTWPLSLRVLIFL